MGLELGEGCFQMYIFKCPENENSQGIIKFVFKVKYPGIIPAGFLGCK